MEPGHHPLAATRLGRDAAYLVAKVPVILFGVESIVMLGLAAADLPVGPFTEAMLDVALLTLGATPAIAWFVVRPLLAAVAAEARLTEDRELALRAETARQELEGRLGRAVSMAESEDELLTTASHALDHILPGQPAELLLADAHTSELRRAVATPGCVGCAVDAPGRCAAARRGQTLGFTDSDALDTCTWLRARGPGFAATCVPVSVVGKVVGVLHTASTDAPLTPQRTAELEALASHLGNRLGLLRVVAAMEKQAATDPLTGLANRRAFQAAGQELLRRGTPFALAVADLDHFKRLNDTYGHETGDRALKRFSRVFAEAVQPGDVAARIGGEEFVFLFASGDLAAATTRLDGVRATLAALGATGPLPAFTVSIGLTSSLGFLDLESIVAAADRALYQAKHAGRDRVVVANSAIAANELAS